MDLSDWCERYLVVTQGDAAGQPFRVLPWERAFLARALAPGVRTAALSCPRANGKSTLISAVAVAHLVGQFVQPRGEIIVISPSFRQSRIVYDHCIAFLRPVLDAEANKPRKEQRFRVLDSANSAAIYDKATGAALRCVAGEPSRVHGLAPSLAIFDEPAQVSGTKADRLRAAVETSLGKIPSSRLICIGTRPASRAHWFDEMLTGEADVIEMHAAEADSDPLDEATWRACNPSWEHMPSLREVIRSEAEAARKNPALLSQFKALRLNAGTVDFFRQELVSAEAWLEAEGDAAADGPMFWGVDLGAGGAMSSVASYHLQTGRLEALGAFGTIPTLEERGEADGCGGLYSAMAMQGDLLQLGGKVPPVDELLQAALDRWGRPEGIACDRWRQGELEDAMAAGGLNVPVYWRGMGFLDGGNDLRSWQNAFADGRIVPVRSLLLRSAFGELTLQSDPAGNMRIARRSENGRRGSAKDDAAVASVLAVGGSRVAPARPQAVRFAVLGAH